MYTWVIDYFYIFIIISTTFSLPILALTLKKKYNYFFLVCITYLLMCFFIILFFYLKDIHRDLIESICFEYPTTYIKINAPEGCADYKIDNGIGWSLKAIFWFILGIFYLIGINILFYITVYIKKRINKKV